MPTTTTTPNSGNNKLIVELFREAAKAKGKGGGGLGGLIGKLGYTMPGKGVRNVKKPGSRGGHPWTDASGGVHYGPPPKGKAPGHGAATTKKPAGARAARSGAAAGASPKPKAPKPMTAHNHPGNFKRATPESKLRDKRRMLTDLNKTFRTGVDKHGNPLNDAQLGQVKKLKAALQAELKAHRDANPKPASQKKELYTLKEALIYRAYKSLLPFMPLVVADDDAAAEEEDPDAQALLEPEHTGVMVAFYLDTFSPDTAVQLAIPGGETWDALHLTLAYLGDSTELGPDGESQLYRVVSEFAANRNPLEGTVSGVGLFNNTEEGGSNAFYASFDSPGLPDFRSQLMGMLQANSLVPVQNHGFTPHITLQYVPKGQPLPQIELPQLPVIFSKVTVKWGDKRTDFSLGRVTKEVKTEIAAKEETAKPFTAYKDINGRWRWLVRSSSAFEDRDGEFVTQKALEQAVEKLNESGHFGVLDWWHTPVKLGTCDFSAMHGRVLVESGTFASEPLGSRIASAIANKEFNPGVSLMFSYNGLAPRGRGRVFDDIGIIQRSLLPEEIASNAVTTMQIINLAAKSGANSEEVNLKMDALKEQRLIQLLGPALVKDFLNGSEMAEKSLEMAGVAFKAVAPKPVGTGDETGIETKADGVTAADPAAALVEGSPEEEALETPEEEAAEPPDPGEEDIGGGEGDDPDALLVGFFQEIKSAVMANMQEFIGQLQTAISSMKPATASKEVTDLVAVQALAIKETMTVLEKFGADNTAIKARLDVLEGKQPPAVQQRVSATTGNQVTDPKLLEALKEQNKPQIDANDPFKSFYEGWVAQGAPLPLNR